MGGWMDGWIRWIDRQVSKQTDNPTDGRTDRRLSADSFSLALHVLEAASGGSSLVRIYGEK